MSASFNNDLLAWYDAHKRDLPWRGAGISPYHIWLSEIMLQQTVVKTVIPYFLKFTQMWPNWADLAEAPLEDVLFHWQGLGYYRRAHNLHKCAQIIVHDYEGRLPRDYAELLKLPGLGPYTAAAIAAIAFGEKVPVLDGNIVRVLSRYFCVDEPYPRSKDQLKTHYMEVMIERPGDFAQGLMDLSQQICRPQNPQCSLCPLAANCLAHLNNLTHLYPRKGTKASPKLIEVSCWVIQNAQGLILMRKRPENGLLAGLYDLPTLPAWDGAFATDELAKTLTHLAFASHGIVVHKFTHLDVRLTVKKAVVGTLDIPAWSWMNPKVMPISTMVKKVLQKALESAPLGPEG